LYFADSNFPESEDLPYLYWIPKLHKAPFKERYIAVSSTCSTKELSVHLTKILSAVKEGQQRKTLNSFLVLVLRLRFVNVNYKKNNKTVFGA
jgi:hypothetical protein